jgi:hypothetical protein
MTMTTWTRVNYGMRENPGCYDNGNGALAYVDESVAYPGVERVTVVPYARNRGGRKTYYRLADGAAGAYVRSGFVTYATAAAAYRAACVLPEHYYDYDHAAR